MQAWLGAIKSGEETYASFELGSRLAEIANLGVVACRLGKGFDWDAGKMIAKDVPEAAKFIRPQARACNWL